MPICAFDENGYGHGLDLLRKTVAVAVGRWVDTSCEKCRPLFHGVAHDVCSLVEESPCQSQKPSFIATAPSFDPPVSRLRRASRDLGPAFTIQTTSRSDTSVRAPRALRYRLPRIPYRSKLPLPNGTRSQHADRHSSARAHQVASVHHTPWTAINAQHSL